MLETNHIKVFFAAPLYTLQDRMLCRMVAKGVMNWLPDVDVTMPMDGRAQWRLKSGKRLGLLFKDSIDGINQSKAVIAMLDGADAESGVGFVVGYAHAKGLPVVGFRTDCRPSGEKGLNVMLNRGCTVVIHQPLFDNYYLVLAKDIARRLCSLLKVKLATRRQRQEHYVPWPSDEQLHTTESLLGYRYGALGKSPWLDVVRSLAGEALQYRTHCVETDWVLHDTDGTGQALVRLSTFLDGIDARDLDRSSCRAAEKLIRMLRRRLRFKGTLEHAAQRGRNAKRESRTGTMARGARVQAAGGKHCRRRASGGTA